MHHIALFIISLFLAKCRNLPRYFVFSLFLILFSYRAIFADTSWDYEGYIEYYKCNTFVYCGPSADGAIEKSFSEIASIIEAMFGNEGGAALIALYASASLAIKLYVLDRRSADFGIAFLGYLGFGWFIHEMTQIRVGLSIALLWLALSELESERRPWRAILFFLMAVFIHASSLVGLIYLVGRKIQINNIYYIAILLIIFAIGGRAIGTLLSEFVPEEYGGFSTRLVIYLSAREGGVLGTSQLNFFSLSIISIILFSVRYGNVRNWDKFSIGSLNCLLVGVCVYFLIYWIPVVGLRVFEIYASFLPFVAASCVYHSKKSAVKIVTILMISAIFLNMMVRNGLMKDFIFQWQAQYSRLMEINK